MSTMAYLQMLLLLAMQVSSSSSSTSDSELLLRFMKGIEKDPLGTLTKSWLPQSVDTNGCPSNWHGVYCDSRGRVSRLDLQGLGLSGQLPPNALGGLDALTYLSLRNNFFSGELPSDLGRLSLLEQLDLSNNLFTGFISFQGKQSLQNLTLSGNKLSGVIHDDAFKGMGSSLLELDLSSNGFTGAIPSSIASLEKLVTLDLSFNRFNGSIPEHLNLLQSLEFFHANNNRLSGPIPPSSMLLHGVQSIDFSMNRLSGPLPWLETLLPPNMAYVNMSYNRLSGYLAPEDAANLFANKIQVLDLSHNQLSGSLPSFEFVFSLRVLKLNSNQFTGFVPPALLSSEASLLEHLDLSDNQLSGNVWAISAARLNTLNLSSNSLSGGVPPRIGSSAVVDLSGNLFSGNLSVMKTWSNSLESINLSNNSLTGTLPNETAQLLRLIALNLAGNKLSGEIPPSFGNFPKLTSLDISGNLLVGPLPTTFFYSTTMATLKLSNNQLTGGIPVDDDGRDSTTATAIPSLTFSPLRQLDLSGNSLNGTIPNKLLTSLSSTLEVLDLSSNNFSGAIPPAVTKLDRLQQLDLSLNHLSGPIPVTLPASLTHLNLANNNLSGSIPPQLETKFPPSSFFPGNTQLESNGFPAWAGSPQSNEPKGHVFHYQGGKHASKAALIGGCIAAFILAAVVAAFLYYRRAAVPSKPDEEKSKVPVFRIVEKDFVHHAPSDVKDKDKGKAAVEEPQKRSPSRKGFFSSLRTAEPSAAAAIEHHQSAAAWNSKVAASSPDKLAGDLFLLDSAVVFTAEELSRAPAEVLGRSSHGTSYKATLDSGHTITVKWLKEGLAKSKREFTMEAKKFGSIKHENILPLRGYYWGPREHEKLILTDYIAYGSLADRLGVERSGRRYPPLTWQQRLRVLADVARGLCYLHGEHRMPHGNLKASNVLFDGPGPQLRGCLTDYGLHRLMTAAGTANQFVNAGALGYRAPELSNVKRPKPTTKADVYAYGIIILEVVTGKSADDIISGNSGAVDLPDWVKLLMSESRTSECLDPTLASVNTDQLAMQQQHALDIALRCTSEASSRPNIRSVCDDVVAIYSSPPQL